MFFINHTDIIEGSAAIIEIEGPLNSDSAPDFDDYISKLLDNKLIYLLLDMRNLNFISSEGIGAALLLQKSVSDKKGLVILFNLNSEISSLFKLLGFDKVFSIASDRADALQILDRHLELFPADTSTGNPEISGDESSSSTEVEFVQSKNEQIETDSFTILEDDPDDELVMEEQFDSFVIECIKCKSLIRIKESGDQLCPFCSAEFTVTDDKKAVFKIREIHS